MGDARYMGRTGFGSAVLYNNTWNWYGLVGIWYLGIFGEEIFPLHNNILELFVESLNFFFKVFFGEILLFCFFTFI